MGGSGIAVDVVGVARLVTAQGGDHRDVVSRQQILHRLNVDVYDFSHIAQPFVLLGAFNQPPVHAGQAHRLAALHFQKVDQGFVHLARQHHLNDVHGLLVRDPPAFHEHGLLAQPVHQLIDLRPAAVNQHHPDTDEPQQHNVLHHLLLELVVDHGVAAVFDDHGFAVVAADVGQGFGEHLRPLGIG